MVARASYRPAASPFSLLLLAATAALPAATSKLVALSAVAPKIDANNLPEKVLILKWGTNDTVKGPVKVGKKTLACLAANQAVTGFEEVVIDFGHNTVESSPTYKGEPAAVAATHCKPQVVEGEGLFLLAANWTEEGKKHAEHYPDVSAAVGLDDDGEVIFVHSAAICRQGCARDIKLFSASLTGLTGVAKVTTLASASVDLDALRQLLHLSADATPKDINDAIVAALAIGKGDEMDDSTPAGKKIKALSSDIAELRKLVADGQRQIILAEAREAGREIPAAWLPDANGNGGLAIDQLRTLSATLPATVPLAARTPGKTPPGKVTTLSGEEKLICQQLGIKEEDYLKTV